MVQRAMKFTPEVLLSAPRRSSGIPNPSGTKVLYTSSTYDFLTHQKTTELRLLNIQTGGSEELLGDEASDLNWLTDDVFCYLQANKDGTTSLYASNTAGERFVTGVIDAAASNLKLKALQDGAAVVFSAPTLPDGTLYSPEKAKQSTRSSGRLYTSLMVRHWDKYETQAKNALWYGKLTHGDNGRYTLSKLSNAFKGHPELECPIQPFGGSDNFDIMKTGIIFVTKDPKLNPALNTKCNIYLLHMYSWTGNLPNLQPVLEEIPIPDFEGAATCPVFDATGTRAAWLMMKDNGYEADQNRTFVMADINFPQSVQHASRTITSLNRTASDGDKFWSLSPSSICFSLDSHSLLAVVEDQSYAKLCKVDLGLDRNQPRQPQMLTEQGHVNDVKPLPNGTIFVSGNSLVDNSWYAIVDDRQPNKVVTWSHSSSAAGGKFGLRPDQVSSIWTPANDPKVNMNVHSIVVKPSNFDSSKKYPVAYLIHGGPQGAWTDAWSTRWNLAVFAEQGYIVIAPNPTGSTGYSQAFTDAIRYNWGGDPYEDVVKCFEWVGENMPEADNDNAVALGGSYGGYMMNWIQGHPLGRRFKCLVCHDGVFSFPSGQLTTDELYFPMHDLGYPSWLKPPAHITDNPTAQSNTPSWTRWDPANYLDQWSTPQLTIHSEKDYRLPIGEGLAAFNVLQARGVESQLLVYPDENHWVLNPENSLTWHKVVLNWINKFMGLPPYSTDDPNGNEFWGGIKSEKEGPPDVPAQGKSEM
ncbi:hypothetical protein BAUCODRAFT_578118 [Baudoinia panamericana UAMH 10762]|uniref:Dipeptidyl-peptidase V n=1 Tax=Baudoinia panamericana (strain UAMH 10762) TaxID=717646 RepID=M2N8I8_BAUPA|nr:uncharacterized protein BAUCODRAFT_578118 [Baudoinia panamericana UAMH 10762]EMC95414.1 hypothetical protein BAUCODRAFT_578118 [Baudoinia panamericana UAMH 10762]